MNFIYRVTIYDLNKMQEAVFKNLPLRPLWQSAVNRKGDLCHKEDAILESLEGQQRLIFIEGKY